MGECISVFVYQCVCVRGGGGGKKWHGRWWGKGMGGLARAPSYISSRILFFVTL